MTMLHTTMSMLGLSVCLAAIAACDPDPRPDDAYEEASLRGGGGWGCHTCGYSNSPMFGTHPLDRFRVEAGKDEADLRLVALEDPAGVQHPARVEQQDFIADTPTGPVQGGALVGWSLVLEDAFAQHVVDITAFAQHPDWASGQLVPTYALAYVDPLDPDAPQANVCAGLGPDETSVVLIAGELYDFATKTVEPDQPEWVTMACRGHALMKLKFLGHDPNDDYGSSWEQRQAALKMITADYCGTGQSFTAVGQPLLWVDELGNFPIEDVSSYLAVEAGWTEDGASCLGQPRLVPRAQVDAACLLPTCSGDADLDGARWLSLLPKP